MLRKATIVTAFCLLAAPALADHITWYTADTGTCNPLGEESNGMFYTPSQWVAMNNSGIPTMGPDGITHPTPPATAVPVYDSHGVLIAARISRAGYADFYLYAGYENCENSLPNW
jgi:hypothetical protein